MGGERIDKIIAADSATQEELHADRCVPRSPGDEDLRTPIGQAEEFYRALEVLGQETMHVKIPDEYHGTRAVSHRLMIQLYLKAWFDKYRDKPIA